LATSAIKASPWVQLNQSGAGAELVVCSQSPLSSQHSLPDASLSNTPLNPVFIPESPCFQSPARSVSSHDIAIENQSRQAKHYRDGAELVSPLSSCKPAVKRSKVFSFASPEIKQPVAPRSIQRQWLTSSSSSTVKTSGPVDLVHSSAPSPSANMKREIEATLDLLRDQKFFEDFFNVS
jgi:hypothetical protein